MIAPPSVRPEARRAGFIGRKFRRSPPPAAQGQPLVTPLAMLAALELLAAARGTSHDCGALGAALPMAQEALAAKLAPLALARIGIEAHWRPIGPCVPEAADLPLVLPLVGGGAVLITSRAEEHVIVRDAQGLQVLPFAALRPLLAGEALHSGPVDPVSGASDAHERDLIRRNPRAWLLGAYLAERRPLGQMLLASALLNLCALAIPLYMRAIYDRVVPNLAIESLWALSIGVVLVLVFELLLKKIKARFVEAVATRVGQAVQHRAVVTVLRARAPTPGMGFGAMLTALRDLEQLSLLVPGAIATVCVDLPFVVLLFALIAAIGGFTVLGPILGALGLVLAGMVCNYALKLASRRASKLVQARSDLTAELTSGWTTIKANHAEGLFEGRWDLISDHLAMAGKQARHWSELPASTSGLLVQLVTVMVVVIGVLQIKAGVMTTGALIAVVLLTGRAMVPVAATVSMFARAYQSIAQFQALAGLLQTEPERDVSDPAVNLAPVRGALAVAGLSHTFSGSGAPSLSGLTFSLREGERVALIGKSGSGKSTLLQLLAGLIPAEHGLITLDGHALDRFAIPHLRRNVIYSAQDAMIFEGTVWHNILLGMPEPSAAVVDRAIRCSALDSFVARTAEGYMRQVGPRGSALSGGQRQSLLLARALVRDPKVLLLDEPTASLDVASEQAVIAGLAEATRRKTLVVATHRLALLEIVDRVIWLEEGRIVADRPKAEVLAQLASQNGSQNGKQAPREAA
ncbi:ATP-binding cassette domain-containing protein [Novosphingobium sp.]|uniref:ATP-binding cassette domain-containing protein n=1 Tax=Novosphingobium sp. TaxID=1874826 RepID=UPI00261C90A9|nr:ATP-binding cassette domain-containing protein [Novosphingobium sp.]